MPVKFMAAILMGLFAVSNSVIAKECNSRSEDSVFIVRSKVKTTAFRRSDLSLKPFAVLSCKDGVSIR